jgi:hypothetical protein
MKKKTELKKLALLGLAGGVILSSQAVVFADDSESNDDKGTLLAAGCGAKGCAHNTPSKGNNNTNKNFIADADESFNTNSSQLMTEQQLKGQLNEQGKQQYNSLSPEGKATAVKLASRSCKGTNDCKGQGINPSSCAGKNSCAGTSACNFKDKNEAVKAAAESQAQKRAQTNGSY